MKNTTPPPPVRRWQLHRLGFRQFPADISSFEIQFFFSFDAETRRALKSRRRESGQLACGLHLGFLRMTGRTLDTFHRIPKSVMEHVGRELSVDAPDIASLRALYPRRKTLYAHQSWVAKLAGFVAMTDYRRRALVAHLRRESRQTLVHEHLRQEAHCWLYENKIYIPRRRTVDDLVRRAMADEEKRSVEAVESSIPESVRKNWRRSMFRKHDIYGTVLNWIQHAPKKRSVTTIDAVVEKIEFLRELGVGQYKPAGISQKQQEHYAARLRRLRPSRARELRPARFAIALVCYLHVEHQRLHDMLLDLINLQGMAIFSKAKQRVMARRSLSVQQVAHFFLQLENTVDDKDIPDDEFRARVRELIPRTARSRGLAHDVREELSGSARRTRRLTRVLLKIGLSSEAEAPIAKAISTLRSAYKAKLTSLPEGAGADFAPRWQKQIDCDDRQRAMRGYEAAALQAVRDALRRGTLWCEHSLKYRSRDQILISTADWSSERSRHYRRMRLPRRAARHATPLLTALEEGLEGLAAAVDGEEVLISDRGLHLQALEKEQRPDRLEQTKRALARALGNLQLPELMLEVDSLTRFSWQILGRPARSEKELVTLYGAIMAHGMGHSASSMAMTIPEMSEDGLKSAMSYLEDERALVRANEVLIEFMGRQPVAKCWGDGTMVSSDSMHVEVSKHLWNARVDPKSRKRSVGIYTHVSSDWALIYNQPIPVGDRQAGHAIEGVVRQVSSKDIDALAVDTHGYTDFGMGLSKLLGFDLCPRLRDLRHRRIHVPKEMKVPDVLKGITVRDVAPATIAHGWDSLVRVAASIESDQCSATLVLQRFGAASRGDSIYEAGAHLGKINRSIFLCDFCTNVDFRREVLRVLNYGEALHTLQRALHPGPIGSSRGRRHEELVAISGSMTMLSSLVMAGISHRLQQELDGRRASGEQTPTDEELRHISPAQFGIVNFKGRYHFPVKQWASQLMSKAV